MEEIQKGTTDVVRYIHLTDSTAFTPETAYAIADINMQYTRELTASTTKVDATVQDGLLTTHQDGKIKEVNATDSPGLYMVCWPDAAFVTGVGKVTLVVTGAGLAPTIEHIVLVDNLLDDVTDSSGRVDVGKWIGTAVTLGGGLPDVNVDKWKDSTVALDGGFPEVSLPTLTAGFGASSPDRLVDHLKAMMSKTAAAPTSGVGTYSPATDSLEVLGEGVISMEGSGFATSTDSLAGIRDAIDVLVAPSIVSSSALSGSGFLSDCVSLIRKAVDEPSTTPKYNDSDLVELLQAAFDTVLTDIHVSTDHPITCRHNITLVSGEQDYIMPPGVAELLRVAKINSTTNLPEWELWPGSYMNPGGSGFKLEGNVLRLLGDLQLTDTLELLYIPNAEPTFHKAILATPTTDLNNSALTMILNATIIDGTLDIRENAYVGYMIRILSSNATTEEERLIIGYNANTRVATYNKAFTRTHEGSNPVTYEVVPFFSRLVKHVVCLRASIDLLSQEGNEKRMKTLTTNYQMKLSAMRRAISKKEGRFPHHFDGDTWDNENRGGIV